MNSMFTCHTLNSISFILTNFVMNNNLIAILGIAFLTTATIGFGAVLATPTTLNNIGGDDDVVVPAARANISLLGWTEEVAPDGVVEVGLVTFTVTNEDAGAPHTFEVCAVLEGPAATYVPAAGSAPECVTTASIAASGTEAGVVIIFSPSVDVSDLVDISLSIEEVGA